jgi:putative NADH-flavin reductase
MHIALYGATGLTGSRLLTELLSRGHKVTAVVRHPDKVQPREGLTIVEGDVSSAETIAARIKGADVVVSAYGPPHTDTDQLLTVTRSFLQAVKQAGVGRFLFVGGAGSLEVSPGVTLIGSGHLPQEWLAIATSHSKALELAKQSDVNWTCFSPAAYFGPGERTGKFRLGTDKLIADAQGNSRISMEDAAIAIVDELESPKHERGRFTAGY